MQLLLNVVSSYPILIIDNGVALQCSHAEEPPLVEKDRALKERIKYVKKYSKYYNNR